MKRIALSGKHGKGKFALVDDEDFAHLNSQSWYFGKGYAHHPSIGRMQRVVLEPPEEMLVDHINHDTLDNRRSNLRLATKTRNNQHIRRLASTHRYRGVSRPGNGRYRAVLQSKSIGVYNTVELAAIAYNEAAIEKYGEFAVLNEVA